MRKLITLSLMSFSATAAAHHSRSHYAAEVQELEGELVAVHWVNPHVGFTVDVTNEAGEVETWRVEGLSNLGGMLRAGVTEDRFTLGERVRFLGSLSVRRPRDMLASNLLLEDGSEILLGPNHEPYFATRAIGRTTEALDEGPTIDAAAENRGIFRVWSGVPGGQRERFPFTAAAIAARAKWNPVDNFAERCEPEGMPRIMRNPHPFEFIDRGAAITLVSELYDLVRTIHMDQRAPPADAPPSALGYSVGRWDGNALIVDTTRVNWPYFDNLGTPQSESVRMRERFTVSDDQSRLDYELTVTDPATFSEPAVYERYWLALGARIEPYNCQVY
jgi:Family of unknown function (DUF6152)